MDDNVAKTQLFYTLMGGQDRANRKLQGYNTSPLDFFKKRGKSIENALGTTLVAVPTSIVKDRLENASTDQMRKDNKTRMNEVAKKYGYNTYHDVWDARDEAEKNGDQETLNKIDNIINPELQAQANVNAAKANKKAKDYADYRENSYVGQKINQDNAKFAGSAINTLSTGFDVASTLAGIPNTPVVNAIQGGIEGFADELEENGGTIDTPLFGGSFSAKNWDKFSKERALSNMASGAAAGLATGGLNKAIGGRSLIPAKGKISGLAGKVVNSGVGRGALSGAVGGAVGAGTSAAINGQDVMGSVVEGAKQGAIGGAVAGGVIGGANRLTNAALNKFSPETAQRMQNNAQAWEKWKNSGSNFDERLTNTLTSGESPVGEWIQGKQNKTLGRIGDSIGNRIKEVSGASNDFGDRSRVKIDGEGGFLYAGKYYQVEKDPISGEYYSTRNVAGAPVALDDNTYRTAQEAFDAAKNIIDKQDGYTETPTTAGGWLKKAGQRAIEDLNNKGVGLSIKDVSGATGEIDNIWNKKWEESADTTGSLLSKRDLDNGKYVFSSDDNNINYQFNTKPQADSFEAGAKMALLAKTGNEPAIEKVSDWGLRADANGKVGGNYRVVDSVTKEPLFENIPNEMSKQLSLDEATAFADGYNAQIGLRNQYADSQTNINRLANGVANELEETPTTAGGWLKKAGKRAIEDLNNKGVGLSIKPVNSEYPEDIRNMQINDNMQVPSNERFNEVADLARDNRVGQYNREDIKNIYQSGDQDAINALENAWRESNLGEKNANQVIEAARDEFLNKNITDNNPQTQVYRMLQPQAEVESTYKPMEMNPDELMYGESQLSNRTRRGMLADTLERFGNTLEGAQTNVTRAAEKDLGIESAGKVVENVRKKTGLTNLETQAKLANEITGGENSLMDSIQRQALSASEDGKGYKVDTTPVLNEVESIVDKYADTNMFGSLNARSKFISNLKGDIANLESDVLTIANRMKANAADLRGKGVVDPKPADAAKARIYTEIANKLDDISYKSIPQENIDAMFDATISEMRGRANQATRNGNNDIANAYNRMADNLDKQPRTAKAYRSFKKDFVDVSKVAKLTARAENGAASQMGRSFGGGLKRFASTFAQRPTNAALAKVGGAVNSFADRIEGNRTSGGNIGRNITPEIPTPTPTSRVPSQAIWNEIGRTEGTDQGEKARTARYLANVVNNQDAQSLEDLAGPTNAYSTSVYDTMYGTQVPATGQEGMQMQAEQQSNSMFPATGDYWTDVIGVALTGAINDRDVEAFTTLYGMYQDALAEQQKSASGSQEKLTDTQRRAYAAENALSELATIEPDAAYNLSKIPVIGDIATMGGNQYKSATNSLATQIGYMLSGANITPAEAERIGNSYVPQPFDNETVRRQKLQRASDLIQRYKNGYAEDYSNMAS